MAARDRTYTVEQLARKRAKQAEWRGANPTYEAEYRSANRDTLRAKQAEWRGANPTYCAEWRAANPEKRRAWDARHRAANPEKYRARDARRRATKLRATPAWANHDLIAEIYAEAHRLGMHVDHIVPLRNPRVCGFHVEHNLQLLTADANRRKGNKLLAEHMSHEPRTDFPLTTCPWCNAQSDVRCEGCGTGIVGPGIHRCA